MLGKTCHSSALAKLRSRAATAMLMAAVGFYYLWAVRAASAASTIIWAALLPITGFVFRFEPAAELLALPNPWDAAVGSEYKVYDLALYKRRYYLLYHGAAPAVMLFTPWRLLTGYDLPENFAVFLLSFGGFLFSCGCYCASWS
jgi:hypothetical protein